MCNTRTNILVEVQYFGSLPRCSRSVVDSRNQSCDVYTLLCPPMKLCWSLCPDLGISARQCNADFLTVSTSSLMPASNLDTCYINAGLLLLVLSSKNSKHHASSIFFQADHMPIRTVFIKLQQLGQSLYYGKGRVCKGHPVPQWTGCPLWDWTNTDKHGHGKICSTGNQIYTIELTLYSNLMLFIHNNHTIYA